MENDKKTAKQGKTSINCGGKILSLESPVVMGIVNVTPDSFYDGGNTVQIEDILQQCKKMLEDGATILDIGGQSSRPNAELLSAEEELTRVIPAIESISKAFPNAILSIDTFYAKVAEEAINAGAHIVNDISAGDADDNMISTVADLKVPYILMHRQGNSKTMQQNPSYENVVQEVWDYLLNKITICMGKGIHDILIDPGFGFGKTVEHNYALLDKLHFFSLIDQVHLLVGLSRKSMICKALSCSPKEALNGTSVLHAFALERGAKILRVHDVKEAMEAVTLFKHLKAL